MSWMKLTVGMICWRDVYKRQGVFDTKLNRHIMDFFLNGKSIRMIDSEGPVSYTHLVMIEFMTNKGDGKKCDEKYDPTDKQSKASLLLGIHCFPPFIVNV